MARSARPEDLYRLRVPTEPQLSPDGSQVAFTVKVSAPRGDGYRQAIWLAAVDGSATARQVTLGVRSDHHPRFLPDGSALLFISDRRHTVEEEPALARDPKDPNKREDGSQVHLLPLTGGEARRVTDLPRGVESFEVSPDGRWLAALSSSLGATRAEDARRRGRVERKPADPPESDYRYLDRLDYMLNGMGFTYDRVKHLWLLELETGAARRLVAGPTEERDLVWSPDGRRIAFVANRRRDHDLHQRSNVYVVDVATGAIRAVTDGDDGMFVAPAWSVDGSTIVTIGGRFPRAGYRNGVWRFAADGSEATAGTDLLADSDLMPASAMNSDLVVGAPPRLAVSPDGRVRFSAPVEGSYELWEVPLTGGDVTPLTRDRHFVSWWDVSADGRSFALVRAAATSFPEVHVAQLGAPAVPSPSPARASASAPSPASASAPSPTSASAPSPASTPAPPPGPLALQRVSTLNDQLASEVSWVEPVERRWRSDGREIQGWLLPAGDGVRPLVLEIHGGPHTLYGWSPMWEWQVLAAAGVSVLAANPRGSEGYGEAFNRANLGDWGEGPMADVMAGIDAAVADGLADPDRLGVTGGSYGGYLTNWIIARTRRFRAAITCRSVSDMYALFLTGDISGGEWAEIEFGRLPWNDPGYFHSISPLALAREIRTPLLIQHAEQDLRCVVTQAEALFTVLRSLRRPVRFMRVPEESHELTRSGTPFRRVENLVQVRTWFVHYLVKGARTLPPLPRNRGGK